MSAIISSIEIKPGDFVFINIDRFKEALELAYRLDCSSLEGLRNKALKVIGINEQMNGICRLDIPGSALWNRVPLEFLERIK